MNKENETKLCKHCKSEIPKDAKVCPNCRKKQGGILKWIIIVVVILVIAVAATGGSSDKNKTNKGSNKVSSENKEDKANTEQTETETEIEYIKVTSTELIDAFDSNQIKCKNTYHDKMIEVTGKVKSIGTDILDNPYVTLGHDTNEWTFTSIQCYAGDEEQENKIAELSEGQTVTIRGRADCDDSLGFDVKDIEIVD